MRVLKGALDFQARPLGLRILRPGANVGRSNELLFVLRVYRLPQPHILPLLKRYGGCRSWVDLAEPLSTAGATPVVSDAAFAERVRQLRDRLSLPGFLSSSV